VVTNQAIAPILNSFGALQGQRILDVACGTGRLAAAATQRGALAEGLDFAGAMVAEATRQYRQIILAIRTVT